MAAAACPSCTDLLLARYRDDQYLTGHHYALGEQYVVVDGIRFCYQECGEGPTVVILPGLGTNIDFWQRTIPVLARSFHVIAVDPPGIGRSDKPDASYDLIWICDRLKAFLDARGVAHASFIGGSFGGHLAALLALRYSERVDKLVLMGSSGFWEKPGPLLRVAFALLWNDAIVADHMRRAWPDIFSRLFIRQTPLTRELLRYQMAVRAVGSVYEAEGLAFSRTLRSIFCHSLRGDLERLRQPVLLIWGEYDAVHLPKDAVYFRDHIPDSRLVVVPNSGHEVMIDQMAVFDRLVTAFLRDGTAAIADHYHRS